MSPMTDFFSQALLAFSGMVFLVWILPGLIQRSHPAKEDREVGHSHPRLKTHP
jgi:hypothetical protein